MKVVKGLVCFAFMACCASACGVLENPRGASVEEATSDEAGESASAASTENVCWKHTAVRGIGTIPTECPNAEKSGLLCYPRCPAGYTGAGPVCWQSCPGGYTDDGALCRRDAHITSADTSACPWYDKCGLTLAKGCSKCPAGYANDGCTCRRDVHIFAKKSEGRGAGTPMSCREGMENNAGLCYSRCGMRTTGAGPVCWVRCSGSMPIECGVGCARSTEACAMATADQVLKPIEAVVQAVLQSWGEAIAAGVAAANTYKLPICGP